MDNYIHIHPLGFRLRQLTGDTMPEDISLTLIRSI